eukprot:3396746-Rhodomonas_salina.1
MCGTELGYGATRCAVLSDAMVLQGAGLWRCYRPQNLTGELLSGNVSAKVYYSTALAELSEQRYAKSAMVLQCVVSTGHFLRQYRAMRMHVVWLCCCALAMRCPVLRYAMLLPGTSNWTTFSRAGDPPTRCPHMLLSLYAMSVTDIAYAALSLRDVRTTVCVDFVLTWAVERPGVQRERRASVRDGAREKTQANVYYSQYRDNHLCTILPVTYTRSLIPGTDLAYPTTRKAAVVHHIQVFFPLLFSISYSTLFFLLHGTLHDAGYGPVVRGYTAFRDTAIKGACRGHEVCGTELAISHACAVLS